MAKSGETGRIGEDIAARYLESKGYKIIERNHREHYGEIDIVATDLETTVIVEVKTVSARKDSDVTRETYRPEFNFNRTKYQTVSRAAKMYIAKSKDVHDWRIDLIAVELNTEGKSAKVRHLKGVSIE